MLVWGQGWRNLPTKERTPIKFWIVTFLWSISVIKIYDQPTIIVARLHRDDDGSICVHCGEERCFTSRRWRSKIPKTEVMRAQVQQIWRMEGMDFGKPQNSFWNILYPFTDCSNAVNSKKDRYARDSCVICVNNTCPNRKELNDL